MPRNSSDGIRLNEAAGTRPANSVDSEISTADNHLVGSGNPITFIDKLPVNGRNLRVPVADFHPGNARILESIADLARFTGGFHVFGGGRLLRACIQFSAIRDVYSARLQVLQLRNQLIGLVNTMNPELISGGGGCKDIEAIVRTSSGTDARLEIAAIVEVSARFEVRAIDTLIAKLAPLIEQLTNGTRGAASINGIADRQLLCAQVAFDPSSFSLAPTQGKALAGRIVELYNFTCMTKQRISACNADIIATANVVLGAIGPANGGIGSSRSTWTAHDDHGAPLAIWYRDHHGHLAGRICLPVRTEQAGRSCSAAEETSGQAIVATTAQCRNLLNPAVAAIGLAQSLANLHAHAAEAIAQGNPGQHAYDLASLVGARGNEIVHLVEALVSAQSIRGDRAATVLDELRGH